jgi:predicted dehydrogenase
MLRVGAVGCGLIGRLHQQAYLSHPDAKLVCVCDTDSAKADARAKEINVKAYYSVKDMLAQEPLDAVDVVTAEHLHFEPVMACLEAGKHTMCEKPLSLKIAEAEQMVAKARERGVHLAINHNRRFAPAYVQARKWFDAGEVGKLAYIMMKLSQGGPASSWQGEFYQLYELQTHSIDLLHWFGGDIMSVSVQMARAQQAQAKPNEPAAYTSMAISVKFAGEAVATLLASWDSDFVSPIEHFELCGDRAEIIVDNIMSGARLMRRNDPVVQHWKPNIFRPDLLTFNATFEHRVHAFVSDLVAGHPPVPTGEDGLKTLRVLEAIIKSWQEQRTITLQ